jgi:hypothetical protein
LSATAIIRVCIVAGLGGSLFISHALSVVEIGGGQCGAAPPPPDDGVMIRRVLAAGPTA